MSDTHDGDVFEEITRVLHGTLGSGGPPVEYDALHLYVARMLPGDAAAVIRQRIVTWQEWHDAYWEIQEALALNDIHTGSFEDGGRNLAASSGKGARYALFSQIDTSLASRADIQAIAMGAATGATQLCFESDDGHFSGAVGESRTAPGRVVLTLRIPDLGTPGNSITGFAMIGRGGDVLAEGYVGTSSRADESGQYGEVCLDALGRTSELSHSLNMHLAGSSLFFRSVTTADFEQLPDHDRRQALALLTTSRDASPYYPSEVAMSAFLRVFASMDSTDA